MPPCLRKGLFLVFFLAAVTGLQAQLVKVYGKITNNNMEPLANVSVHLKTSSVGTLSKEDGSYELFISKGKYEIVVSMVGYKTTILPVVVNDELLQNIILQDDEEKTTLSEVVIKVKLKDRAEEIMKTMVEKKDSVNGVVKNYSYKAYIKAVQQDSSFAGNDQAPAAPTVTVIKEILLKVDRDASNRIKELEKYLGVRLFNRTTRSVSLTDVGRLFLAQMSPALQDIHRAMDAARSKQATSR